MTTGSVSQAARDAGYVDNGNGSIRVTASRLLTRADVTADRRAYLSLSMLRQDESLGARGLIRGRSRASEPLQEDA